MSKYLLLFSLSFHLLAHCFGQCIADSTTIFPFVYNGKTYEVIKEVKSWTDAAACAVDRGGYLVEINDFDEHTAVYNGITSIANVSSTYTVVQDGGGIAYVWIGATDRTTEGNWVWDGDNDGSGTYFWLGEGSNGDNNGQAIGDAFTYWGGTGAGNEQEPDNFGTGQDCAAMSLSGWPAGTVLLGSTSEWNDLDEQNQLFYVIEYDSITGIHKPFQKDVRLFPNPAEDILYIRGVDVDKVQIYNSTGQLLLETSQNSVDLQTLQAGIYFVRLISENNFLVKKIIVE